MNITPALASDVAKKFLENSIGDYHFTNQEIDEGIAVLEVVLRFHSGMKDLTIVKGLVMILNTYEQIKFHREFNAGAKLP